MNKCHASAIILKHSKTVHTFPINEEIESNTSLSFLHNSMKLSVKYSATVKTSCSDNLCYRHILTDLLGIK